MPSAMIPKEFRSAAQDRVLQAILLLIIQVYNYCTGSCEPGSRCRPNECIFGCEKLRGVGILELGVYGQGEGNGKFSLQATGDQGGRILSQLGGFPSK
jgi:hypothetical protein